MNMIALALVLLAGVGAMLATWYLGIYQNWIVSMLAGFVVGMGAIMAVPDSQALPDWGRLAYCVLVGLFYRYMPLLFPPAQRAPGGEYRQDILEEFFSEGAD